MRLYPSVNVSFKTSISFDIRISIIASRTNFSSSDHAASDVLNRFFFLYHILWITFLLFLERVFGALSLISSYFRKLPVDLNENESFAK